MGRLIITVIELILLVIRIQTQLRERERGIRKFGFSKNRQSEELLPQSAFGISCLEDCRSFI